MATPHHSGSSSNHAASAVSPDTLITVKISVNDVPKRLKLPLRDLGIAVLPDKLRQILDIKSNQHVVFERYSDSAGGYITLDENSPQVFKTLIRAAKAKLKLRLKATVTSPVPQPNEASEEKEAVDPAPTAVPTMVPAPIAQPLTFLDQQIAQSLPSRDSTALDQRSIGSGIFEFREARASQQTLVNDDAAASRPTVPEPTTAAATTAATITFTPCPPQPELAFRSRAPLEPAGHFGHAWSVYCNECDKSMVDAHYHCSICDGGDYDLCEDCVAGGKLCPGEGHWLIKRFIKDGKVVHSTTERISPRPRVPSPELASAKLMPGAFAAESKAVVEPVATRTCNNCVVVLPEREFVTCTACEDFDLCLSCHAADKHGHHPAHGFHRATEQTILSLAAETKLAPGRNVRHNAICDGCEQKIYGVRHKCLNCPDWDYCGRCIETAGTTHRHHRFAALYEPIADQRPTVVRHYGIYCDGPLCNHKADQSYIQGVRYKCAICNDTDFCAACEALPGNAHNRTHPLIKFKTPVRNVNVSTENEDVRGNVRVMGDRRHMPAGVRPAATVPDTLPLRPANAATQVHTVADIQPTEVKKEDAAPAVPFSNDCLKAHFVRDTVVDGMAVEPEARFAQVWTMRNPGPHTWPAGCSVRYVGGDNMLNVDNHHPASVTAIAEATESNVVGRPVKEGEEVAFKVVLKAPMREGRSISYWRLKAPDGTPFGHRLWCDIDVATRAPEAVAPAASLPSAPIASSAWADRPELAEQLTAIRSEQMHVLAQLQREQSAVATHQMLGSRCVESMNEEERRAAFKQRVAQIKADVLRSRAARHSAQVSLDAIARASAEKKITFRALQNEAAAAAEEARAVQDKKAELKKADEGEKVRKIIEEVTKEDDDNDDDDDDDDGDDDAAHQPNTEVLERSDMLFPTLEKESPASSTYQSIHSSSTGAKAAYVENEEGEVEQSAAPVAAAAPVAVSSPITAAAHSDDLDEDIEVLSAKGDESEDDGFLTDEEYDILDASDQETVASMR